MDSMDHFQERCEALDQQRKVMGAHPHPVERRRRWWRSPCRVAAVIALGFPLVLPLLGQAKTFHCRAGDVQCLIDAINTANANGQKNTIRLEAGTYTLTAHISPRSGLPVITSPLALTITGQGAETTIIERGARAEPFSILQVAPAGVLTLKGLTLRGGFGVDNGGGIFNEGTLALRHTTVAHNLALEGGGIFTASGTVTIAHSIIADNQADTGGGGLSIQQGTVTLTATTVARNNSVDGAGGLNNGAANAPPSQGGTVFITESAITHNSGGTFLSGGGIRNLGTMVITNTTIAANSDNGFRSPGGGILNLGGTLLLTNSTLADNTARNSIIRMGGSGGITNGTESGTVLLLNTLLARNSVAVSQIPNTAGSDCSGSVTSLSNNLIGDPTRCTITLQPSDLTGDPGLGDFTDNGRPGHGHFPLLPTSQAIDAGNDAICPRTDQLGRRRIGPCDIGAIEFRARDDRQHDEEDEHEVNPADAAQVSQ